MMSPDEALERLKEFSRRLQFYHSQGLSYGFCVLDAKALEALEVAIACLEEKCHE